MLSSLNYVHNITKLSMYKKPATIYMGSTTNYARLSINSDYIDHQNTDNIMMEADTMMTGEVTKDMTLKQMNPKRKKNDCDECGKTFRKPCLLQRHQAVHMKDKAYECTECHKQFSQKSSLQRHYAHRHHAERKHKCLKCAMSFAQNINLRRHIESAHPLKVTSNKLSFPCPKCSCVFTKLNSLNRHKTREHPKVDVTSAFRDDAPVHDANVLANNVLEELKRLQSGMGEQTTVEGEASSKRKIKEQPNVSTKTTIEEDVTCTVVDEAAINLITVSDKLYPASKAMTNLISAQIIRRSDNLSYYVCEFCAKEFPKLYDFLRHRRSHTNERPYKCPYCVKSFQTNSKLTTHCGLHIFDDTFGILTKQHTCYICQQNYDSIRQLDVHIKDAHHDNHTVQYNCPDCHATFTTKTGFSTHKHRRSDPEFEMLKNLLPEPINLETNKETTSYKQVEEHYKYNKQQESNNKCKKSDSLFDTNILLEVPQFGHNEFETPAECNFKCVYCPQTFRTKPNCQSHMRTHLKRLLNSDANKKPKEENIETCLPRKCLVKINDKSKTTNSQEFIELQMLPKCQQHKHRNFTIEQLNKSTETKEMENCKRNEKTEKQKICQYCAKVFSKASDLTRHLRTHTHERPFECTSCKKSFALKSTLNKHQMTHQTQKRQSCPCQVCGKQYASKTALVVHLRLHTSLKPFQCDICQKKFRTSGHRISHLMAAHRNVKITSTNINESDL